MASQQVESANSGQYTTLQRKWKKGDVLELILPMDVQLMESNPLVEETRNQIALKRGPIVYCIESPDLPGSRIFDVIIPSTIQMFPVEMEIKGTKLMALEGTALIQKSSNWDGSLYRPLSTSEHIGRRGN